MDNTKQGIIDDETVQYADDIASATLAGYAEYLKQHEKLTSQGINHQLAVIESLKSQHAIEAKEYKLLAAQAEAAGDLRRAAFFTKEADQSARLITKLSQQLGSSLQILSEYAKERQAALLAMSGGSIAAQRLINRAGLIGNSAAIGIALNSGDDVEVTKAIASMVVGDIAGTLTGAIVGRFAPPLAPAAIAYVSLKISQ